MEADKLSGNKTKKFILLSTQRTGSTYLEQCLNSHPQIRCYGEILLGYGGLYDKLPPAILKKYRRTRTLWQAIASGAILRPAKTIRDIYQAPNNEAIKCLGFRLMYNQIRRDRRVLPVLREYEELYIIHLHRKNLLKQFVSLKLMHNQAKFGRYSAHAYDRQEVVKISIDASEAIKYFDSIHSERLVFRELFSAWPTLEVSYEEMVGDGGLNPEVNVGLEAFLGLSHGDMKTAQRKMNPSQLDAYVENYEELSCEIRRSKYADLLSV